MKLSILLPTHNRADVLPFAIESVLAQSFTEFELLVCGDGCTDSTAEVVQRYAKEDARVRWFDFPKAPGFGYANRNRALREARGALIGFMAHDDLITADHFALLVQAMEDPAAHLACTEAVWAGRDGAMVPALFHLEDKLMREEFLARRWNRIPATCFMHRREALDKVGWWSEELPRGADLELWGRIVSAYGEQSIRCVSVMTCFHFRAHWRLEDVAPDTEPVWLQLHRAPGRLPEAMHWQVSAGMTEQQAFWERLKTQPESIPSLRVACHHAVMTYAWLLEQQLSVQQGLAPVAELDRKIQSLREQKADLQAKLTERDARVQRLKEEMESMRRETKVPKWLQWLRGR
jgi:hypothetical protein